MTNTYNKPINNVCKILAAFSPNAVIFSRCGACGEFTYLFIEFCKALDIPARKIQNCGIDHTWAEVKIDGTWIPVETTQYIGLNASHFYNCSWTRNLLYVYSKDSENKRIDLTEKYICPENLAELTIHTKPNTKVSIEAPTCPIYCYSDSKGVCTLKLGPHNYSIHARKWWFSLEKQK